MQQCWYLRVDVQVFNFSEEVMAGEKKEQGEEAAASSTHEEVEDSRKGR